MKLVALAFILSLSFTQAYAQEEDKIYSLADEQPTYPGGMSAFFKYIQSEMQYPDAAKTAGVEGHVFVEYVIEKDGSVSGAKILKSLNGDCDKEALRLISNSVKWTPGKIDGKEVRVKMALPLNFRLPR
ncbi:MAG: energy transducer TonB [Reichenbachiella sp.]|uniref:energy transducer TonB n=1 Tax=Reichenbachiella sp. TaxID=2184521 RepID=UPI00296642BE|nr:energy transducer TonB [Reichenbachiella sp.]MDW3208858.1 energy transducer TonB [Reichenbachiella sp.]